MNLRDLLAVLMISESNFRLLHWKSSGHDFDRAHQIAGDYYEKMADLIDVTAEQAMRSNQLPMNYAEAYQMVNNMQGLEIVTVDPNQNYGKKEVCEYSARIISDIMTVISNIHVSQEMQAPENMGIKSALEATYDELDHEKRYLLTRRMTEMEK